MEFSRQEYWSGLPFCTPGDHPDPRIQPRCPTLQADSLPSEPGFNPSHNFTMRTALSNLLTTPWGSGDISDTSFAATENYDHFHANHILPAQGARALPNLETLEEPFKTNWESNTLYQKSTNPLRGFSVTGWLHRSGAFEACNFQRTVWPLTSSWEIVSKTLAWAAWSGWLCIPETLDWWWRPLTVVNQSDLHRDRRLNNQDQPHGCSMPTDWVIKSPQDTKAQVRFSGWHCFMHFVTHLAKETEWCTDDSTVKEQKILHLVSPELCSMYLLPLLILKCILFYHNNSYWVGQEVNSGFSVRWYRKTQMNFLANPITITTLLSSVNLPSEIIKPRVILGTPNLEVTSLWWYSQ